MEENNNFIKHEIPQVESLYSDACNIIEQAQSYAYRSVNEMLVKRNWLLGMRIQHEVLADKRAEYGKQIIKQLAEKLVKRYGRGFSMRNLYYFIDFYQDHFDFFQLTHEDSNRDANILQSATAKSDFSSQSVSYCWSVWFIDSIISHFSSASLWHFQND